MAGLRARAIILTIFGHPVSQEERSGWADKEDPMKNTGIALMAVFFLVFATAVYAAESEMSGSAKAEHIVKADDLTGKMIQDKNGNDIGDVKSIVLDTSTGASYALILLDNKLHPVPITAFKRVADKYTLNVDKGRLAQSPGFTEEELHQQMANKSFDSSVYKFFGITAPWDAGKETRH